MHYMLIFGLIIGLAAFAIGCSLGWQLLQQNGRMLLRLEALEKRLEDGKAENGKQKAEMDANAGPEARSAGTANEDERANRFGSRALANSKIKRDGLKAGTPAPEFRLPRLEGGELALSELRGRLVLLVFSSPKCGPCNALAPQLEKFYRKQGRISPSPGGEGETASAVAVVMISQGEPEENRAKVDEHRLGFPVVLQKQWEVSRDYAYFATPVAYLIDESGVIGADVAVGVDGVVDLMTQIEWKCRRQASAEKAGWLKQAGSWPVTAAVAVLRRVIGSGLC